MTLDELKRLNDAMLADISRRLSSPLNDDGLRAWYRHDGGALLEEVIALRRERAEAMRVFTTSPPLEGLDPSASMIEVADRLTALWAEHQQGVWQRAEVKRIREKLAEKEKHFARAVGEITDLEQRAREMNEQIEQLQAQLVDAISDGLLAKTAVEQACAERSARVRALLAEATAQLKEDSE